MVVLASSWYYALQVAPKSYAAQNRTLIPNLYPYWNGTRAILRHENPYREEITRQNQFGMYGKGIEDLEHKDEHRFAYPVYAAFLLLPIALLPFSTAQAVTGFLFLICTVLAVGWWRERWDRTTILYCLLTLASYPVIFAWQLRQPTLLFAALLAACFAAARAGHLSTAGILASLSTGKPQLAIAVLLPLLIWTITDWPTRKRLASSMVVSLITLYLASSAMLPGWFGHWLETLNAYSHYAGKSPLVIVGPVVGTILIVLVFCGLIAALWRIRRADLLFSTALSVAIFQLLVPYEYYNTVLLLCPVIWITHNAERIRQQGWAHRMLFAAVVITLAESWLLTTLLPFTNLISPTVTRSLWMLPAGFINVLIAALLIMLVAIFPVVARDSSVKDRVTYVMP
jgi:hypothetical protein